MRRRRGDEGCFFIEIGKSEVETGNIAGESGMVGVQRLPDRRSHAMSQGFHLAVTWDLFFLFVT
ncbi:hypothetical protein [Sphingobacterium haloxyli]|uniref:hypothetical protein n=1 Tax=Sphingobacterium haloxyli TaxID=2100533 RepID=UPI001056FB36|nr:hypothetical protein [Sphingobacterium haloxyli]